MPRFLLRLALLLVLGAGAVWLAENPGSVRIDWLSWRLTTSVPVLALTLFFLVLPLWFGLRVIAALGRFPAAWQDRRRRRADRLGYQALSDGLAAVAGGQAKQAQKLAAKAEKLLQNSDVTGLLSAQSAEIAKDPAGMKRHYEALRLRPETALLGWRGLMGLALETKDRAQAISLGESARKVAPADTALATDLFALLVAEGRLGDAQALAIDASRRKAVPRKTANHWRALLLTERARIAERDGDLKDALSYAEQAMSLDANDVQAGLTLARLQSRQGLTRQATLTLERSWRAGARPEIFAAYAALVAEEAPLDRLRRLERLVVQHGDDWITLVGLGEAALSAKLWGQARKYLTEAARRAPTASVLSALARLEIAEYRNEAAAQTWLKTAPVCGPAWVCGDCAAEAENWALFCAHCGALDRSHWRDPSAIQAAASSP